MSDQLWWLLSIFGPYGIAGTIGAAGYLIAAWRQDRRTLVAQVADDYVARCRRGMGA